MRTPSRIRPGIEAPGQIGQREPHAFDSPPATQPETLQVSPATLELQGGEQRTVTAQLKSGSTMGALWISSDVTDVTPVTPSVPRGTSAQFAATGGVMTATP